MKILVVRGKNLASLAGHFEVDFCAPPLDRAGLVAITGPTGAGKTTLLDAICLALFDRTPRFANRGGVVIASAGEDRGVGLRATDVRGILRHGAVEGWAEVEFLGVDDRRWRARWEVRRARGRADGRIQAQQMKLIDPLDGRVIAADRKSDTLAAIEARLGLDFDQFRRSVLLAQGEFSAFLQASGGERAELLERMTGTWLYRELGRGAFERAKQAEAELELVRRERAALRILDGEQRERLEAEAAAARRRQARLGEQREATQAALRWYTEAEALDAALAQARASLAELDADRAGLDERERLLAQVEGIAAVRERMLTQARWARELGERQRDLDWVKGELPLTEAQRGELIEALACCDQALARAQERRRRLQGELDRARELDTQAIGAVEERGRVAAKLEVGRLAALKTRTQLDSVEAGLADARARLEVAQAWLEAHAGLRALAEHWPHYRSLLGQQRRELDAYASLGRNLAELGPRSERCHRLLGELVAELERASKKRSQTRTRLRKVERDLDEQPALAELRHRHTALDGCRARLDRLRAIFERHGELERVSAELEGERRDQALERDHRRAERRRVELALERSEQVFEEAQRGLRQLEAVRDLAEHRAELRPGEACPICGATEHPAAAEQAAVDAVITEQRARVAALLRERDELQREQGEHLGREQLAAQRIAAIEARFAEQGARRSELDGDWREALAAGPLLPPGEGEGEGEAGEGASEAPEPAGADMQLSLLAPAADVGVAALPEQLGDPELATALWALDDRLASLSRELGQSRAVVETLVERQRERQALREEAELGLERARVALDAQKREFEGLSRELEDGQRRAEELATSLAERWTELEDVGPEALAAVEGGPVSAQVFRARLGEAGSDLLARLEAAVQRHGAQRGASDQIREGAQALATRAAELRSQHEGRVEAQAELAAELEALDARLVQLRSDRAALLDGRPVAEVARELEVAVELAQRDREERKDALARVERELQAQRTRAHTLADQVEALRVGEREVSESVEAARRDAGVDRAALDELLGRAELWAEGWLERSRRELEAARARLQRREAVVGERERVVEAHRAQGAPALSRAEAEGQRARLEAELEAVRAELFEREHQLQRDREDRQAAEALGPKLEAHERAARIWGRLRDVIGSATGDKFQKFAQSLTLELLLTQANAQLRELKPRYALARVPNHDLELQLVDRDLGDEVRSIRGLSGGETFLVSLALALALASLAAEDCRLDSLFIDEGFGTLDAHSLDVAVSTLDALQAEGRQIGVISHVPGLAERVGVEIRVEPVSSGRSRVQVIGPA